MIEPVAVATLPTQFGDFRVVAFTGDPQGKEHLALVRGNVRGMSRVLVRVHSECLTGDVLGSLRCDCREQLTASLENLGKLPLGVLLYMRREVGALGSPTRSGHTHYRIWVTTRSKPTTCSALATIIAIISWPHRCCSPWGSGA